MSDDLAVTLGRQETATLVFTREAPPMRELGRIACTLANDLPGSGGGDLLIGVDKHGNPDPTPTDDAILLTSLGVRDAGDLLPRCAPGVWRASVPGPGTDRRTLKTSGCSASGGPSRTCRSTPEGWSGPSSMRSTSS